MWTAPSRRALRGLTISITKGAIARNPEGHLEGYFLTRSPFGQIQRTLEKLGLGEVTAQSSDTVLSTDASKPSTFQSTQRYAFAAGEILYDFATDQEVELPRDIVVNVSLWATGHLEGRALRGTFRTQLQVMGLPVPKQGLEGKFEVLLS